MKIGTQLGIPLGEKVIQKGTGVAGNVQTIITVPAAERWKLLNASIVLTTDATVVNRYPNLTTRDVDDDRKFSANATVVTAGLTAIDRYWTLPLSRIDQAVNALGLQIMNVGEDVVLSITGGVAGDAYDYLVEYLRVNI